MQFIATCSPNYRSRATKVAHDPLAVQPSIRASDSKARSTIHITTVRHTSPTTARK